MSADVKIGDKWLSADMGWIFSEKSISPPEPNLVLIEIPGTSAVIDLTESLSGDIEYKQRKLGVALISDDGKKSYYSKFSELANTIHGKKERIIFSDDAGFFWIGRVAVTKADPTFYGQTVEISATVDPYKYEVNPETYSISTFPGDLTIVGNRKHISPVITCSNVGMVSYLENNYPLTAGINRIPEIFFGAGEHVLTFAGSGTTSVDYQGASL